jgi:hypothetical protein
MHLFWPEVLNHWWQENTWKHCICLCSRNLQRTVTTSFTLSNADNGYVIVVDNGATPIITVPAGLMAKMEVGFLQLGTGDVSL